MEDHDVREKLRAMVRLGCSLVRLEHQAVELGLFRVADELRHDADRVADAAAARGLQLLEERTSELRQELEKVRGNVWLWQGNGEDELEGLTSEVLIPAAELLRLLRSSAAAFLELQDVEAKELRRQLEAANAELQTWRHAAEDGTWTQRRPVPLELMVTEGDTITTLGDALQYGREITQAGGGDAGNEAAAWRMVLAAFERMDVRPGNRGPAVVRHSHGA